MRQNDLIVEQQRNEAQLVGTSTEAFAKLRELTGAGYVPQPPAAADAGGILLRHPNAPDLVLHADGTIDLPLGQRTASVPSEARTGRLHWPRIAMFVLAAAGLWLLAIFLTVLFLES